MRNNEEEKLQVALVQHLMLLAPKNVIWFAIPNGIPASKRTGARFKAQGVRAGVYDMMFLLPGGKAAALELKSATGRPSPAQKAFGEACEAIGIDNAVASNIDQAISILQAWNVLPANLYSQAGK